MLSLIHVQKTFSEQTSPILKNIDLRFEANTFCAVIGGNGSGKSTLFKCITGEYRIDEGCIKISNEDVTHLPLYKRAKYISSITQDIQAGTIADLTLFENMVLSLKRGHKGSFRFYRQYEKVVIEIINDFGTTLESYLHMPLKLLSGGQRQIIATLMALSSHPNLLLLDEHTSALDINTHHQLMSYAQHMIKKNYLTTLMITHNLEDAVKFADRIIMLHQGSVVLDINDKKQFDLGMLRETFYQFENTLLKKRI